MINYNENVLAGARKTPVRRKAVPSSAKNSSEETLVPSISKEARQLVEDSIQVLNLDWSVDTITGDDLKQSLTTKKSRARLPIGQGLLANASGAVQKTASVLGKRSRGAIETGLEKMQGLGKRRSLRPRAQPSKESEEPAPSSQKGLRIAKASSKEESGAETSTTRKAIAKPITKTWLAQGLYVGQDPDFDPRLTNAKNQQKKADASVDAPKPRRILPMPMFAGKRLIENGRHFRLPFDIFNPLPPGQPKPEEWKKTQKSERDPGTSCVPG